MEATVAVAAPLDAEMAEDAMGSHAHAVDTMEYDEEAPRYDDAGDNVIADVEIGDAQDDARSTEMGEEDARDYAVMAAASQHDYPSSSMVEAPMVHIDAPVPSSDGMQASQVDEHLQADLGYEPVDAGAPEQSAQIVEVQDAASEVDAQPPAQSGQAGDTEGRTTEGHQASIPEPSAAVTDSATAASDGEASTSALATSTSIEQQDPAQPQPEASAEGHDTQNADEQASRGTLAAEPIENTSAGNNHVSESNNAASHTKDAPQTEEGNDSAAHNGDGDGANVATASSSTQPRPLRLTFEEESFVLFPTSSESSQYLAYPEDGSDALESIDAIPLSVPVDVFWQPLEALFKGLRVKEALGEFLEGAGAGAGAGTATSEKAAEPPVTASADATAGSDLVLRLPDLGLVVREDSVYTREVRLVDLVRLHEGLGAQSSLHIEVSEDDCFLRELKQLEAHVADAGAREHEPEQSDEEEVETGETSVEGQPADEGAADGNDAEEAQPEEGGADAAEQTFVTVDEGREDDEVDDEDEEAEHAAEAAGQGDYGAVEADAHDAGADEDADAEAEVEEQPEEPSYEPVEEAEAGDGALEEQGEEKIVEYEEEEEDGAEEGPDGEQQQHEGAAEPQADADQYEEEEPHDEDNDVGDGEEQQQDEEEEQQGDYPEDPDAEQAEDGYGEEGEAAYGHAEDGGDDGGEEADESAAAAGQAVNGSEQVPEAATRLGKRSFDGDDQLEGENDAPNDEAGAETKKVKASH